MKSINNRIANNEIVITYTDNDAQVVICKPETYKQAALVHLNKDFEASWDDVEPSVHMMNRLSRQMLKIFRIGEEEDKHNRTL